MVQKALSHREPCVVPRGGGGAGGDLAGPVPAASSAADAASARVPAAAGAAEELQAGLVAEEVWLFARSPEPRG